jgi:hypothetical protein
MGFIKLEIDVKNPDEIITNHKGQLMGIASLLLKRETKKKAIQKEIYEQVIAKLGKQLEETLKDEGVLADVHLTIEESKPEQENN